MARDTNPAATVGGLKEQQLDVAMKYIYKGMEIAPDTSAALLKWHEAVFEKGGIGSIMRVLTDRPKKKEANEEPEPEDD
jgi:hypothetical protein